MRAFLLLFATGCGFATVSDKFACDVDRDCDSDRTCDRGFCVVAEVTPDAAVAIDAPPPVSPPDAPPEPARECGGGDAHATVDGVCFVAFRSPLNRAAAQASCEGKEMALATVKSATANAVVQSLVVGVDAFLGATDAKVEGQFVWPDGSGMTFANFAAGEPNNGGGGTQEDCLIIQGARGGSWDDRPCDRAFAYVCGFSL